MDWLCIGLFLSLSGLALTLPLSIALTNIALGLATACLAFGLLFKIPLDYRRLRNPVVYAFLAYCAVGIATSYYGVNLARSLGEWHKDFHKVWVSALLLLAGGFIALPPLAGILALGLSSAAVIGIIQTASHYFGGMGFYRAHAFIHPVSYGDIMAIAALGGLCFISRVGPSAGRPKKWAPAFLALAAIAALLSGSRGAMLGLVAGWLAIAALQTKSARKTGLELLILALAAFASFHLRGELLPGKNSAPIQTAAAARPSSTQIHFVLWGVAWRVFRDHPWVGVGPANYQTVFPVYHPAAMDGEGSWSAAHNMYLEALAERGMAGFAALIAVLAALTLSAWRNFRKHPSGLTLWACASACGFWIMNLTETSFQNEQTMTLILLIWGLAQNESNRKSRNPR